MCYFRQRGVSCPVPPAAAVVLSLVKREAFPDRCGPELLKPWGLTVKSGGSEGSGHPQQQA